MTIQVVGIGASAGGLAAFSSLLSHLATDTGLAFVFVQHLDPKHHSSLSEILARVSAIPVQQATEGLEIKPNHLYVIPPDAGLEIANQVLKITPRAPASAGPHTPIDHFLRSLAQECGSRAIGVILSGAGTDGAAGLEAVKAAGGVTFAQDPTTAKFDSMPQAAVRRGCVDFVLPPQAIAGELTKLGHHPYIVEDNKGRLQPTTALKDPFDPILRFLRDATGVDFGLYRENTVHRRIMRRLALHNLSSLEEYRKQIENDPHDSALHRDLLINVTCFFRDPESFEQLKKIVFPRLVQDRPVNAAIRIWVAGCATGEEVYSIAISLQEYFEETGDFYPVQIFASDISSTAVERARSAKYAESIAADVSPERLNRYFLKVEAGYQMGKAPRDMCVFSKHDLIQDPPFSKLDLISCRNVLMFFGSARKNVIARFHYALNPGGFLVLGRSETESGNLFSIVEGANSIYTKNETVGKRHPLYAGAVGVRRSAGASERVAGIRAAEFTRGNDLRKELERTLLSRYRGAGVVVDETLNVLEILGQTAPYLRLPTGEASLNLLRLIPDTRLFLEVEKLVGEVKGSGKAARKDRVPYQAGGTAGEVNAEVIPLGGTSPGALLVLFEPAPGPSDTRQEPDSDARDREIAVLKQDLADARQRLLSIIEDHQSSAEENQNTAEEAISANEELQSLNEELETAKEELQSTNEELITVNQELLSNNAALAEARDFAMLIIETAAAPLLVLDQELRIKAANPSFCRAFRISSPLKAEGQLLYSVSNRCWDIPRLRDMLERILPDHKPVQNFEIEQDIPGLGHRVLVLNARQLGGFQQILLGIDDVTESAERDLRLAAIVDSSDDAILSTTLDGTIVSWNSGAEEIYGYAAHEITGAPITTLAPRGHEEEMSTIVERILRGEKMRHFETKRRRKDGEIIDVSATISPIVGRNGVVTGASMVDRDITERKQAESALRKSRQEMRALSGRLFLAQEEERKRISRELHDDLTQKVALLAFDTSSLVLAPPQSPEEMEKSLRNLQTRIAALSTDIRQIAHRLHPSILEDLGLTAALRELCEEFSGREAFQVVFEQEAVPEEALPVEVASCLYRVAQEALQNVVRHARASQVRLTVSGSPEDVRLCIQDDGVGFDPEAPASGHRLGIISMKERVRLVQGEFSMHSQPGKGTALAVSVPLPRRHSEAREYC